MGFASMEANAGDPVSSQTKEWVAAKGKMGVYKERIRKHAGSVCRTFYTVGREDPRRVMIHAFKVGLSLTLVSLLYLLESLFKGVGQNAIWAVMTVVVVLEFTAGATLCKGLNRGLGTVLAGSLVFFIEFVANKSNHVFRAIFIGFAVFFIGTSATYIRFFPYIKKNYDYGVVIFLLTFNLITVSSYRIDDVLHIAKQRFYTIGIGCGFCLLMSFLVFPNWSGEDLHNSTVSKLEGLSMSIEACVQQYFSDANAEAEEDTLSDDPIYKAVLDSKAADEALASYASWEPRVAYGCRFPWKQYVKLGAVLRHFGYTVVALHGCLQTEIQTPKAVRALFKDPCIRLAEEVSKVLRELADSIKNRRQCSPSILSDHLHETLRDLDTALKSQPRLFLNPTPDTKHPAPPSNFLALAAAANNGLKNHTNTAPTNVAISSFKTDPSGLLEWKAKRDPKAASAMEKEGGGEKRMLRSTLSKIAITSLEFAEALPFAAFASLLVETVARLDHVIEEVEELGRVAHFKEYA